MTDNPLANLAIMLQAYGFFGTTCGEERLAEQVRIAASPEVFAGLQLAIHAEPGRQLYYSPQTKFNLRHLFRPCQPVYHALLPHISFTGANLKPVWINQAGRAVIAWHQDRGGRTLLIGLDVEEEIIRHRQGDPTKVEIAGAKNGAMWGFDNERPVYLFQDQLLLKYRTLPWADHLGFFLAENLARLGSFPLIEPLPQGAKAAIILTGDDDQAFLEKYGEQLQVIGNLPITYFLHPLTRHTAETLMQLPPKVELGVHPDALDRPAEYDQLCAEQVDYIRRLSDRPIHTVRNHGFLNKGYLGHLQAWEKNGLKLNVNYPGVDGTALTASFLPMQVRRLDGTWSNHYSLLTLFGDGMIYALKLNQGQAVERIRQLARQIEQSYPGVLVFNFHPQNIADTYQLHQEVLSLARRQHWIAPGLESYLEWLETLEGISLEPLHSGGVRLRSARSVKGLVLRYPVGKGWRRRKLEPWTGAVEVCFN